MLDAWFNDPPSTVTTVSRSPAEQREVDAQTAGMALYHYESCMFCARVRKAIRGLQLEIELRDVLGDRKHGRDLLDGGGRSTVPCLRIEQAGSGYVRWMYESADIIRYLVERFGGPGTAA